MGTHSWRLLTRVLGQIRNRARFRLPAICLLLTLSASPLRAQLSGYFHPYVAVTGDQPYGTHEINIPAASYWVNTGLYLQPGETASIWATGTWAVDNLNGSYGPEGHSAAWLTQNTCRYGELVARVGFDAGDSIYCIKSAERRPHHCGARRFLGACS